MPFVQQLILGTVQVSVLFLPSDSLFSLFHRLLAKKLGTCSSTLVKSVARREQGNHERRGGNTIESSNKPSRALSLQHVHLISWSHLVK